MRPLNIVVLIMFVALTIAATVAAGWIGRSLGLPAFIFFVGIAIVSLLVVFTLLINRKHDDFDENPMSQDMSTLLASFETLPVASVVIGAGKPKFANAAYLQLAQELGVTLVDGEPVSVDRLFSRKEKLSSAAIFRLHHTSQQNGSSEETIRTMTQSGIRTFKVRVMPIEGGQLWQIEEEVEDATHSSSTLNQAPVGLFSVNVIGEVLDMNMVLRDWLGYEIEPTLDMDGDYLPDNMSAFIEDSGSLLEGPKTPGRVMRSDTSLITLKGVKSPTVMTASWHELETGDVYATVAVYGHSGMGMRSPANVLANYDESGRTLESEPDIYSNLDVMSEAPFGVVRLDSSDLFNAKVLSANTKFTQMAKRRDVKNVHFKSFFTTTEKTDKFIETGVSAEDGPMDVYFSAAENAPVNVYFSQDISTDCVAYVVDVSKRKELEDRLMQSQKMQAIGQLAGGVAHDFNNLLTVIRLNCDELLGRHPIGDPSYPELQQINQTVARSAGLVRKLLAFSRKQTLRVQTLKVTDTLSDLSVMLKQVMVERVQLDVVHGRGLPPIQADSNQLETILMNLCVNARDAMVEKGGGGTITLSSILANAEDLQKEGITIPKDGGFVIIKVADTGTGMDAQTQKKIFEPFFTTKEQGKGTGLGLATVYGIVEQSGGHLRVESKLGVGTTFKVYFPTASKEEIQQAKAAPKPVKAKPFDLAGQGKILFVEDEDAVRAIAAKTLRKRGYTVTEACDGEEAYEILEDGEDTFDLMISDVVMPGMDGPTLLKKGRELLGDTNIVFISGYAEEEFSDLLAEEPDVTFLPKPFTLTQLAEKVKSVIGDGE